MGETWPGGNHWVYLEGRNYRRGCRTKSEGTGEEGENGLRESQVFCLLVYSRFHAAVGKSCFIPLPLPLSLSLSLSLSPSLSPYLSIYLSIFSRSPIFFRFILSSSLLSLFLPSVAQDLSLIFFMC